jgi:hypothetical protein
MEHQQTQKMKLINKIEGVLGFAVQDNHLSYLDINKNLILDDKVIQKEYSSAEKIHENYFMYFEKNNDLTTVLDLVSNKTQLLPKGICLIIEGNSFPEFYAYTYSYLPQENRTLYKHYIFNIEENLIIKELPIDAEYAFAGACNRNSLFAKYNGRSIDTARLYKGNEYELLWEHSFSNIQKQATEVYVYSYLGFCAEVIIFSTNNGWLLGLDINTGEELWMLKGIDELEIPDIIRKQGVLGASKFKLNTEKGSLYVYAYNVYVEIDASSGKVQKVINQYPKSPPAVSRNPLQQDFWHFFSVCNNILYYPVSYEEAVPNEYRREVVVKIVGISVEDGEIKDLYEFNSEESKLIGRFQDFQLSAGKLFCLSMSNSVYVLKI